VIVATFDVSIIMGKPPEKTNSKVAAWKCISEGRVDGGRFAGNEAVWLTSPFESVVPMGKIMNGALRPMVTENGPPRRVVLPWLVPAANKVSKPDPPPLTEAVTLSPGQRLPDIDKAS
jgi:hypothetical protein